MKKDKWIDLGSVGVDSGQLMICDPCYLSSWVDEPYLDIRLFKDKITNKIFQFKKDFSLFSDAMEEYNGKSPNELIKTEIWEQIPDGLEEDQTFSYNGVSHKGNKKYKQMNHALGFVGRAVCFDSGYGDGHYKVKGRLDKNDQLVEVRILMNSLENL